MKKRTFQCSRCGVARDLPLPGALVQDRFRRLVGIVLREDVPSPSRKYDPILRIMVISEPLRGREVRWYAENVDEVHGLIRITEREAL